MDDSQQGVPTNASQASSAERPRVVTGAATAVTLLVSLELVREVLVAVANWRLYFRLHDYLAGKATAEEVLAANSDALANLGSFWVLVPVSCAAGIALIVWLWRARINSERMGGAAAHRRARGWVVNGWVIPVGALWIPYQVVSDVWRASAPRRSVPATLVRAWWALFVVANFVVKPMQWRVSRHLDSEHQVLTNANLSTVLMVFYGAAGLLLLLIVRRVTAWQTSGHVGNAV